MSARSPKRTIEDYRKMSLEDVKRHEKKALEWLQTNKTHPKYNEALKKYHEICAVMNRKTELKYGI